MQIGEKIKTVRLNKGISQQKLADEIFVSRSTVAKWENGLGMPSEVNFKSLCEFFEVDKEYFSETVSQEEMILNNRKTLRYKRFGWIMSAILILMLMTAAVFSVCGIRFFTLAMPGDRIECINGYYVSVYEETVCSFMSEGEEHTVFGYCDDITDFNWKHKELLGIVPYRRFLCFSKETEPEMYSLLNADGTETFGFMFVLRGPDGLLHYYYRRSYFSNNLLLSEHALQENVNFSYDGKQFELKNYCSFSSDVDFTTGEHILYVDDEPCFFE